MLGGAVYKPRCAEAPLATLEHPHTAGYSVEDILCWAVADSLLVVGEDIGSAGPMMEYIVSGPNCVYKSNFYEQ